MTTKDYNTQDLPDSKSKSQQNPNKKELSEIEVLQAARQKLAEIGASFRDNSNQIEVDQLIGIAVQEIERSGFSKHELTVLSATLKAHLDISRKQIQALNEILRVSIETGISELDVKQDQIDTLFQELRQRKRSSK